MLSQNFLEIIEENFSQSDAASINEGGVPFIDLILINCIMGYIEHSIMKMGTLTKDQFIGHTPMYDIVFNRNVCLFRNEPVIHQFTVITPIKSQTCGEDLKQKLLSKFGSSNFELTQIAVRD
jgi:hypothetical protein